ncbi:D-aminopeptidase [Peptococcaceae bacterium CEB3]|nr:D-aminopeptidase [Peptococcaceae bacterium CEB3]
MKIYISADMEGISGIVDWEYTSSERYDYSRARKLMTGDVNAAIQGAVRAGADQIIVNDSHNSMNNILLEELLAPASLLSGAPKMNSMMEGIDSTCDGVALIGYHAMMNSTGVLNHTFSSLSVYSLKLNGRETGELGLSAYIAGYFNVPVVMVSGDDQLSEEAQAFVPGVKTAEVKEARGRFAAICRNLAEARGLIADRMYEAILSRNSIKPVKIEGPVTIEVALQNGAMADAAQIMPGAERVGSTTVQFTAPDILVAYRAFRTITSLASHA